MSSKPRTFRLRGRAGLVTLDNKIPVGTFLDSEGIETTIYRGKAACYLHRCGGADPDEEDLLLVIEHADAALWLADHGLDVPREWWPDLRGRYEFDETGKPVLPSVPNGGRAEAPALSETERRVLDTIKAALHGITGKEIVSVLRQASHPIEQSTLTAGIIPKLKKWYGVKNRPNVGYYVSV